MSQDGEPINGILNAASAAAANVIFEYAESEHDHARYLRLQKLAFDVQRAALAAGARVARNTAA